ncbi:MAG: YkgJ family cysteine cluster protein [Gammaproteobacteria bacterium]|nr:MAG: YkgJ family cysteine cluster protein [Gammaproteobacteria bacterium]
MSYAMSYETIKDAIPVTSPVDPVELTLDSEIQFDCHPGISCFNACCRNIDITLTPYDIIGLKRGLDLSSHELVARYTVPFHFDHQGLPGLKLATKPGTPECVFLGEEGCTVYEHRPLACRYYALGSMGMRRQNAAEVEDLYFLVKEQHCRGHEESKTQTVAEYRSNQGCDHYDEMNREWRDIIIKKRSGGPSVGAPSERSLQLFDMCSYDMDSFRDFIDSAGFRDIFDVDDAAIAALAADDDELLGFAMRFLKQTLFGENTIPLKEGAQERRLEQRRDVMEQRRKKAVEEHQTRQVEQAYEDKS